MFTLKINSKKTNTVSVFETENVSFTHLDSYSKDDDIVGYINLGPLECKAIPITSKDSFYLINDSGNTVLSKKAGAMGAA